MLNLTAFDPDNDNELLQGSFNQIKRKDSLEIVTRRSEQDEVLMKIKFALTIPQSATISFQNLFKITALNGQFYIAQCLFNNGFSANSRRLKMHEYNFQIVGLADLSVDFGRTQMRPETRADKIVGRLLLGNDIDLADTKHFNDKYYLVSDKPTVIAKHFDKEFVNTLSRYDDLLLVTWDKEMCITFDTDFAVGHSGIVEDIFSHCKFLAPVFGYRPRS